MVLLVQLANDNFGQRGGIAGFFFRFPTICFCLALQLECVNIVTVQLSLIFVPGDMQWQQQQAKKTFLSPSAWRVASCPKCSIPSINCHHIEGIERVAGGILPKVLNSFDMVAIFVAIVLFVSNAAVVSGAGGAAYIFWIVGFLTFLIPGAIVTGQLGLMFPGEGSIYV